MSAPATDPMTEYLTFKKEAADYFQHYQFCNANDELTSIQNHEQLTTALWAYFIEQNPALLPAVLDDLKNFFHRNDDYHGQACVENTLDLVAGTSLITINGYEQYCAAAAKWPAYVKTMKARYEIFELRSQVEDKETRLMFPREGGCDQDFLYYVRLAALYKGDVAPGLKRFLVHRLMHVAKGKNVPYRSAHWGFLDAYEWGRLQAFELGGEFDLAGWNKHVTEMELLYETLPHPDKVIETAEEKAGIEKLRGNRDIHGHPPDLQTAANPCGYTPEQLTDLNKNYA